MKVYVDMDGVLADFFSEAVKKCDWPASHWKDLSQRDLMRVFKKISGTDFFRNLPLYPQSNTLLQSIVNIAGGFSILSSPLAEDYEHSAKMKKLWLEEKLHIEPQEIIFSGDKAQYAKGNILIDDFHKNIINWEAAGGFGIRYQANEHNISDVLVPLTALFKQQP